VTKEQYIAARKELGFDDLNQWLEKLGIKYDTHKSYNCGRVKVSPMVVEHLATLLELQALKKQLIR
jgi:hypothetical protein